MAIVSIYNDIVVNGDPDLQLPPLMPYLAGSFGTVNVSSQIATPYIEKIVHQM